MSKCTQKKAKPQWEIEKNRIQVARQKRKIHDILPDEVEEFDAVIQNARKKFTFPWKQQCPLHPYRQDTNTKSCSVKTRRRIERRATLSDKGERQIQAFES